MPEPAPDRAGWWSLRVRITSATTAIVLVVLTCGAAGLVWLLRSNMVESEATTARQQATQIASEAETLGVLPPFEADEVIIQQQRDGRVVAVADDDFREVPPLPVADELRLVDVLGQEWAVHSAPVRLEGDEVQHVVVARSLYGAHEATESATLLLGGALPAVSLFVAVMTWTVVGRSLRPVEQIRSVVESIGNDVTGRIIEPRGQDEVATVSWND